MPGRGLNRQTLTIMGLFVAVLAVLGVMVGYEGSLFGTAGGPATRIANLDRDGDGVPDTKDRCPDKPGQPEYDGCRAEDITRQPDLTPTPEITVAPSVPVGTLLAWAVPVTGPGGRPLGTGEVRLYRQQSIEWNEATAITLEIELIEPDAGAGPLMNPAPSPTPTSRFATQVPTATPEPIGDSIPFYQRMGARLEGVDIDNFKVDPVPPDGVRDMQPNAINWWKWDIKPKGEDVSGTNYLRVSIYLPGESDPSDYGVLLAPINFTIDVRGAPTLKSEPTPAQGSGISWHVYLLLAVVLVAGLAAAAARRKVHSMVVVKAPAPVPVKHLENPQQKELKRIGKRLRLFVSYANKDAYFVDRLVESLRAANITVWRDKDNIPAGERWPHAIEQAIREATHLLLVVTRAAMESKNVDDEIGLARDSAKMLIPLRVEDCDLPMGVRSIQWINFEGDYRDESYWQDQYSRDPDGMPVLNPDGTPKMLPSKYTRALSALFDRLIDLARTLPPAENELKQLRERLKLFISYSSEDKAFTDRLVASLREHQITTWYDQDGIPPGERRPHTVEQALRESTHVLLVVTRAAVASGVVQDQIDLACDTRKPVIPLIVQMCELPMRIRSMKGIDFEGDYTDPVYWKGNIIGSQGETLTGDGEPAIAFGAVYPFAFDNLFQRLLESASNMADGDSPNE